MAEWEEFEKKCVEFLNGKFSAVADFSLKGGPDSTGSDILVTNKHKQSFYIEAKDCPAQCGQFVLIPNIATRKFEFSSKNKTQFNEIAKKICEYMDENFEDFKEAGTSGKEIDIPNSQKIFSDWIVDKYKNEQVEYFITNGYRIYNVDDFNQAFITSAKYRVKRSGSSSVGDANVIKVKDYLVKNYSDIDKILVSDDKIFVHSKVNLHNKRFIIGKYEYMISLREENTYEIRKLSNTFNANVIFSINESGKQKPVSYDDLTKIIKDYCKK